ncbi:MAG: hypothetical protein ACXAC7_18745 [Candidatus Hodarchaeales archaeon]|jgi:hypothetical protein
MSESIQKIDDKRLKAIKLQALYNQSINPETRIKIAMDHIEGLKELKRHAVRK